MPLCGVKASTSWPGAKLPVIAIVAPVSPPGSVTVSAQIERGRRLVLDVLDRCRPRCCRSGGPSLISNAPMSTVPATDAVESGPARVERQVFAGIVVAVEILGVVGQRRVVARVVRDAVLHDRDGLHEAAVVGELAAAGHRIDVGEDVREVGLEEVVRFAAPHVLLREHVVAHVDDRRQRDERRERAAAFARIDIEIAARLDRGIAGNDRVVERELVAAAARAYRCRRRSRPLLPVTVLLLSVAMPAL